MKNIQENNHRKVVLYIGLALVLLACWWIGWRDFDPNLSQEVIRENIRSGIRGVLQLSIQFILPLGILVFFTREFFNRIPLGQDNDQARRS